MRRLALLLLLAIPLAARAENNKPPTTLRGVLLERLRYLAAMMVVLPPMRVSTVTVLDASTMVDGKPLTPNRAV
jgi:membrane protein CcdC involved in cytochrome C biogenesis